MAHTVKRDGTLAATHAQAGYHDTTATGPASRYWGSSGAQLRESTSVRRSRQLGLVQNPLLQTTNEVTSYNADKNWQVTLTA